MLSFQHSDGIGVSANNAVRNLNIDAPVNHKAIFNTTVQQDLGTFTFESLLVKGQIFIITRVGVEKANVVIDNVDIHSADARHYLEQPQKYGVNVLQGALTIYNINANKNSLLSVTVSNLSVGRKNAPVSGCGVFISGFGDQGGKTTGALIEMGKLAKLKKDANKNNINNFYNQKVRQSQGDNTFIENVFVNKSFFFLSNTVKNFQLRITATGKIEQEKLSTLRLLETNHYTYY